MKTYTVNTISRAGFFLSGATAPQATNTFANTGSEFIYVFNVNPYNTGNTTLTVPYLATFDGVAQAPLSYTIIGSAVLMVGPFPLNLFGTPIFSLTSTSGIAIYIARFTPELVAPVATY